MAPLRRRTGQVVFRQRLRVLRNLLGQVALVVHPLTWSILKAIKRDVIEHVVIGVADVVDSGYRVEHDGQLFLLLGDNALQRLLTVLSVQRCGAENGCGEGKRPKARSERVHINVPCRQMHRRRSTRAS